MADEEDVFVHPDEEEEEEDDDDDDAFQEYDDDDDEEEPMEEEVSRDDDDDDDAFGGDPVDETEEGERATRQAVLMTTEPSKVPAPPALTSDLDLAEPEACVPLSALTLNSRDQTVLLERLLQRQFLRPGRDLSLVSDANLRSARDRIAAFLAREQSRDPEGFPLDVYRHPSWLTLEAVLAQRSGSRRP